MDERSDVLFGRIELPLYGHEDGASAERHLSTSESVVRRELAISFAGKSHAWDADEEYDGRAMGYFAKGNGGGGKKTNNNNQQGEELHRQGDHRQQHATGRIDVDSLGMEEAGVANSLQTHPTPKDLIHHADCGK